MIKMYCHVVVPGRGMTDEAALEVREAIVDSIREAGMEEDFDLEHVVLGGQIRNHAEKGIGRHTILVPVSESLNRGTLSEIRKRLPEHILLLEEVALPRGYAGISAYEKGITYNALDTRA